MFFYNIMKCLKLMSLGGLHPLKHSPTDLVLFGIWSFALWSIISLDILKIYYKEAPVFIDYINTFSEMSMIIHSLMGFTVASIFINFYRNCSVQFVGLNLIGYKLFGPIIYLYDHQLSTTLNQMKTLRRIVNRRKRYSDMVAKAIIRITSLFWNRRGIASLLTQMEERFWEYDRPGVPSEEIEYQEAFLARTKKIFFAFLLCCAINTSFMSLLTLFVDKDVLPYECHRPTWLPFYALWFYQISGVNVAMLIPIICFDTLLMNFITLTHLQFRLLNREIEAMMEESRNDMEIEEKIRLVVDHHHFLMKYTQLINDSFSSCLLIYMLMIVSSMCVEMYNISSNTDVGAIIKSVVYINVAISGFVIYFCIPAQHLVDEAEEVSVSAFSSGWYDRPEFGTAVLMIMGHRRPVKISAGSFVDINLETGLATIKTMLSYCMFLRTMSLEE